MTRLSARAVVVCALVALSVAAQSRAATTYEVGPSAKLKIPNDVPWDALKPGDTVLIHWRAEPYKNKWVICAQGTEDAPITIRGVPGPGGELPVIDGQDAKTSKHCDYWGEPRAVVKIGGARNPKGDGSKWIVIENLDVLNARSGCSYTSSKDKQEKYQQLAAGIWVELCQHLVIRNCTLHRCGNGLFVSSNDKLASEDVLVESCHIYDNGDPYGKEHNAYTEAKGIVFQYNWFGQLAKKAISNNLKDRSSGCVIRYNWFESGDKVLDLVEAEDSKIVRADPRYRQTFVYGNVLIKRWEVHQQVVHYGGDSKKTNLYRKGTLYFYNNTVVSKRTDSTHLFWMDTNDEICDARNNIFFTEGPGKSLALLRTKGILLLSHNFFKPGYHSAAEAKNAIVRDDKTSILASSPEFVDEPAQDFHLKPTSPCRGAATALAPAALPVDREYKKHQSGVAKPADSKNNIGAF